MLKKHIWVYPFILFIWIYRIVVVPLLANGKFIQSCRFEPTCSEYSIQSLTKYGVRKGMFFIFKRIIQCRPGGKSGYDPLP